MRIGFLAEAVAVLTIATPLTPGIPAAVWISPAYAESASAKPLTAKLALGATLQIGASGNRTRIDITRPGPEGMVATLHTLLERDTTVAESAPPVALRIIGEIPGAAIVLSDTYRSLPGGLSYCQAGKEQFLRVISVAHRRPEETIRLKTSSCRENIELASPGIEWQPETATLTIHWLMGPNRQQEAENRTYRVTTGGAVRMLTPE
jgi:hypothetical protein